MPVIDCALPKRWRVSTRGVVYFRMAVPLRVLPELLTAFSCEFTTRFGELDGGSRWRNDVLLIAARAYSRMMPPSQRDIQSNGPDELGARIVSEIRDAPRPVVNTHFLMKRLDLPFEDVYEVLERLVEEGTVEHMEVRNYGHLWWLPSEPRLSG